MAAATVAVPFEVVLTGSSADRHRFQAYEGFNTFAGMSFMLALVANYVETGEVRHKGSFKGRSAVSAMAPVPGSVIVEYAVHLSSNPAVLFGISSGITGSLLMKSLVERVLTRNIGQKKKNDDLTELLKRRRGDVAALVAATEPSIRQAHDVIGNGARQISVVSGVNLAKFDKRTKEYVRASVPENKVMTDDFAVTGFYGNSSHGSVFNQALGRNVPFGMRKAVLDEYGPALSWGLDQYTNETGRLVSLTYTRILAMDGTPKKYEILEAKPA